MRFARNRCRAYARPTELSATARRALADVDNDRFVSVAALWEIAIKMSVGKLSLIDDVTRAIEDLALELLPITMAHVRRAASLPLHHRDPFELTIMTRDRAFKSYGVSLLPA